MMPDWKEVEFKPKFEAQYRWLLGDRYEEFRKYSLAWLRKCIRVNTLKISVPELVSRLEKDWKLEPVPWCKEGFWIKGARTDLGNLIEHTLGYIYVQESASMIPPVVMGIEPGDMVLDMCAAPGSKTSQIAQYLENKGLIVANDVSGKRLAPLGINLQRCGVTTSVITLMQGWRFKGFEFDKVLVDAACSGTGTIRKSLRTIRDWNPNSCKIMAGQQKKLLNTAFENVKVGGVVVYSTCTMEPDEDEAIISWILENRDDVVVEDIELDIKRSEPVMSFEGKEYHKDVAKCLRIWPMDNDTEGFFVCKMRKV